MEITQEENVRMTYETEYIGRDHELDRQGNCYQVINYKILKTNECMK